MDKVERLISIIMILLKKELVSATEFSQLFHVSKRTLLRDMETLSLSNIPIYAVTGVKGGYGIMEEYKVDKRLLSSSDIQHILTALGGLEQLLLTEEVEQTIKKIEAMVSPLPQKRSIQLSFYEWEGRSEMMATLQTCQQAIVQKRLIAFDYTDKDGAATTRKVEPYELHFSESSWYLKGFCLHRQDYRTFKLSRIDAMRVEERTFHPRDDGAEQGIEARHTTQLVTIKARISPAIKDQIIERYGRKNIEADGSGFVATMVVPQHEGGFQFLASFGAHLQIVAPQDYVEDFRNYLHQMMETYL